MSWNTTLGITVRSAIGDTAIPPKYTDAKLAPLILTAAQGIIFNVAPSQGYMVDFEANTITPDPTDPTIKDNNFIYLVTLQTSAMLLKTEVRLYGKQAISIRDGTSAIDLKRDLKTLDELADGYYKDLQKAISFYIRNGSGPLGCAVISPYPRLLINLDNYFCDNRSNRGNYGRYI